MAGAAAIAADVAIASPACDGGARRSGAEVGVGDDGDAVAMAATGLAIGGAAWGLAGCATGMASSRATSPGAARCVAGARCDALASSVGAGAVPAVGIRDAGACAIGAGAGAGDVGIGAAAVGCGAATSMSCSNGAGGIAVAPARRAGAAAVVRAANRAK
jgi:hypothetical protein